MNNPAGKPQTFKCPSCSGIVTVKAVGISVTATCSYCSSVIDVTNANFQVIKKANENIRKTLLEIGARGSLFGVQWEVIGYCEKNDGDYRWDEYLLYNPYHGFRFLVQNQGHWNFIKVLKTDIPVIGIMHEVRYLDHSYRLFVKGHASIAYVKGEFYWRVKKSDSVKYVDYIAPPFMLSVEENDEEITVSSGQYLEPGVVASAFGIKNVPDKVGVACNQPAPAQGDLLYMWIVAAIFLVLAWTVHTGSWITSAKADVVSTTFQVDPAEQDDTITTPSFFIEKKSNVLIKSGASLDNDWLELRLSLVNELSNKEYSLVQAMEYYHGHDSDGYWSEGSPNSKTYMSSVPPGTYRLLIDVDAGAFAKHQPAKFSVKVTNDLPAPSNFWIIVFMIILYPACVAAHCFNFEQQRWYESDYAPSMYQSGEE